MNSSLRFISPLSELLLSRRGWGRCCWVCTSKKTLINYWQDANTFRHYGNQYEESLKTQILDNSAILLLLMYTKDSKLVNLEFERGWGGFCGSVLREERENNIISYNIQNKKK